MNHLNFGQMNLEAHKKTNELVKKTTETIVSLEIARELNNKILIPRFDALLKKYEEMGAFETVSLAPKSHDLSDIVGWMSVEDEGEYMAICRYYNFISDIVGEA